MKKLIFLIGLIGFIGLKAQVMDISDRLGAYTSAEAWFKTHAATADTITYLKGTFLTVSVTPLLANTDTVKIQGSTVSASGETAGWYYMIGSTAVPFAIDYYGIPVGQVKIITKTAAGCTVFGILKAP